MNYVVEKKKMPNVDHFGGKKPFQNQHVKDDPFDEVGKSEDFVRINLT